MSYTYGTQAWLDALTDLLHAHAQEQNMCRDFERAMAEFGIRPRALETDAEVTATVEMTYATSSLDHARYLFREATDNWSTTIQQVIPKSDDQVAVVASIELNETVEHGYGDNRSELLDDKARDTIRESLGGDVDVIDLWSACRETFLVKSNGERQW